jgi:hypothetical protein
MTTKEQRRQIKATNRQVAAWRERVAALKEAIDSDNLTEAQLRRRVARLEDQRQDLERRLNAEQSAREDIAQRRRAADDRIRRELLELRYEIEEDLAKGRIDQADYDFCNGQIDHSLRALDEPSKPGEVRVIAIPRKRPDWDKFARALLMHVHDQARQREGKPPLTEDEHRRLEADLIQARMLAQEEESRKDSEREARERAAAYRRFRSNKPRQLRQDTWDWLLDKGLRELPADGHLGRLAYKHGVLESPELLRSTVIQLGDGADYIIDSQTVRELGGSPNETTVVRLSDRERVPTSRGAIENAITGGVVFDQLDI